jgi:predicted transposase YbfD/YdcC
MIENTLVVIAFITVLVGIVGKSWDEKQEGLRKLTLKGRIVVLIAAITCSINIYKNIEHRKDMNWQNEQREKLRKIAYQDLGKAIDHLLLPFAYVYVENLDKSAYATLFSEDSNRFLALSDPRFTRHMDMLDFRSIPQNSIFSGKTWGEYFAEDINRTSEELNMLWQKYALYYEPSTIIQINSILHDTYVNMRQTNSTLFFRNPSAAKGSKNGDYNQFINKVRQLSQVTSAHADAI